MNTINLGFNCVNSFQSGNEQIFVCNAEAELDGKIFCECGSGGSLEEAREQASQNLQALLDQQNRKAQEAGDCGDKNRFRGGGNKPSSLSQQEFLHKLAVRLGISLGEFIYNQFHKGITELLGQEADQGIKLLLAQIEEQKNLGF